MAQIASQTDFINYISQLKKILVTRQNQPISQLFKVYYNCQTDYYFQIINKNNQIVDLTGREFKIYGLYTDAKKSQKILFFTNSFSIENNVLHFKINTNVEEYKNYVNDPNGKIANLVMIETTNNQTSVVLYDKGLFYPRTGLQNDTPIDVVYETILTGVTIPLTGSFAAGTDISLVPEVLTYAFGQGLITNNANQLVVGSYNVPDADQVFVVANGTSNHRKNLFTVNRYGQAYLSGVRVLTANDRTNVSQLANDIGYITIADVPVYNAGTGLALNGKTFSLTAHIPSSVEELSDGSNYALKTYVDSSVETASATVTSWVNDQGYLTAHQDLSNYATTGQLNEVSATIPTNYLSAVNGYGQVITNFSSPHEMTISLGDNVAYKTDGYITGYNAGSGISIVDGTINCTVEGGGAEYTAGTGIGITNNVISLTATIPTAVSELSNDVPYLSSIAINIDGSDEGQMDALYLDNNFTTYQGMIGVNATNIWQSMYDNGLFVNYALTSDIPTAVSQLTNDTGFITSSALTGISTDKLQKIVIDSTVQDSGFVMQYDPTADIVYNTIATDNGLLTLNAVSGFENDIEVGKVATFENWVKIQGDLTDVTVGQGLNLIGELPEEFDSNNIQVFSRRIARLNEYTTVQQISYNYSFYETPIPLTLKSTGNTTVTLRADGSPDAVVLSSRINNGEWTSYSVGDSITLTDGDEVSFKGTNDHFSKTTNDKYRFVVQGDGTIEAFGNVKSLIGEESTMNNYCFNKLFYSCAKLTDTSKLVLPDKDLTDSCYHSMFADCTSLISAGQLPAKIISNACYQNMFSGCVNLVKGPSILPAMTTYAYCYADMFRNCSSLTAAPKLPAKSIAGTYCYSGLFRDCTVLSSVEVGLTSWSSDTTTTHKWVYNIAINGTFTKPSDLSETYGDNYIPNGWTVVNK